MQVRKLWPDVLLPDGLDIHGALRSISIKKGRRNVVSVGLSGFEANCGLLILHHLHSNIGYNEHSTNSPTGNQLLTEQLLPAVIAAARRAAYGALLYTTNTEQRNTIAILRKVGFVPSAALRNPNSGNQIQVWTYNLTAPVATRRAANAR